MSRSYQGQVSPWVYLWGIILIVNLYKEVHSGCGWHCFTGLPLKCKMAGRVGWVSRRAGNSGEFSFPSSCLWMWYDQLSQAAASVISLQWKSVTWNYKARELGFLSGYFIPATEPKLEHQETNDSCQVNCGIAAQSKCVALFPMLIMHENVFVQTMWLCCEWGIG